MQTIQISDSDRNILSFFSDGDKELTYINEWFVANKQKMKTNIRNENKWRITDMGEEAKSNVFYIAFFKLNQLTYHVKILIVIIKVITKREKVIVILGGNMIKHKNGWKRKKGRISRKLIGNKKASWSVFQEQKWAILKTK